MAKGIATGEAVIKRLDEVVVNRIAAGEVIQRPSNAIKEMLENSLDAGSTFITISIKSGGLKLLKIVDNGHGIQKSDMDIVCERFTTSKLRDFNDLKSISTFGFRGEALASISHVSHLSITSRTKASKCAFKASYLDGKLQSSPQACAGNVGTQIVAEDMFYNVPTRRKAFKSDSEEQQKISAVVSKYAIHNSGISFTLRKAETGQVGNVLLQTQSGASRSETISAIYGAAIGKELLEVLSEDKLLKLKVTGAITNANYSTKKFHFLLFINNRLIDCPPLKHSLEVIYQQYLPKGGHPFIYISLQLPPNNLDVNVHPTKHQVHFLNEEEVIESVSKSIESRLLSCDTSRTFYTQKLFSVSGSKEKNSLAKDDKQTKDTQKVYDHQLVRMDNKLQKLDAFLNKSVSSKSVKRKQDKNSNADESVEKTVAKYPKRRRIRLTSVLDLQQKLQSSVDSNFKSLFSEHTFVGVVDAEFVLLQHLTKLYLINTTKVTQKFFYQILINDFGNFAMYSFSEPAPVFDLAMLGLNSKLSGWTPADGNKKDLAEFLVKLFDEKSEMLKDYFSIDIQDGSLVGLPVLLDQYVPPMEGLPLLILRLATEVNWEEEKECFFTLSKELARFYSVRKGFTDYDDTLETKVQADTDSTSSGSEDLNVVDNSSNADKPQWRWVVEHVIYRAIKRNFLPTSDMLNDTAILQLANLPDLYKVFERC